MGQYYLLVNLDRREYIRPHYFGDGAKLMEFACSSLGSLAALAILLADGNGRGGGDLHSTNPVIGSWAGDRIVVTGDYADEGKFVPADQLAKIRADNERRYLSTTHSTNERDIRWREWWEQYGSKSAPNLYTVASNTYKDVSDDVLGALMDDGARTCVSLRDSTLWFRDSAQEGGGPNMKRLHEPSGTKPRRAKKAEPAAVLVPAVAPVEDDPSLSPFEI